MTPMDEKEYRKRWEESLEKRLEGLDNSVQRLRGELGVLEGKADKHYVELHEASHDATKAAESIGAKLDNMREDLRGLLIPKQIRDGLVERWNILDDLTSFYTLARKGVWLALIGAAGVLLVYGIRQGLLW